MICDSRYPLNRAVTCHVEGPHNRHEGVYFLAGQVVRWTDSEPDPRVVEEPLVPTRTSMQEAFERAKKGKRR